VRARIAALALTAGLGAASPAHAGDPIMPLAQVKPGMRCTGYSVVRGTEISSFDAEIVDVVTGEDSDAQILLRASGGAVEPAGVGAGFSGSPIYCPDAQGVARNAGAVAAGTGDFGHRLVLATPIERILGERVDPPAGARRAPRSARRLVAPLSIAGLPPSLARIARAAGRRARRPVLAGPSLPRAAFPSPGLRPGSAAAVGLASGDVSLSAIGTVAYTDGPVAWLFAHPFEGAGARSLLLQDAWVHTVVNNPVGLEGADSYKLAVPGNDLGTVTNDAPAAVVGRLGALPTRTHLRVAARNRDMGSRSLTDLHITDESALDNPAGGSSLGVAGTLEIAKRAQLALRGSPASQSGSMCVGIVLRQRRRPLRFCNTYVGTAADEGLDAGPGLLSTLMATDFARAVELIETYDFAPLSVQSVQANLTVQPGRSQAFLLSARAPARVRAGQRIRVRLLLQRRRGRRLSVIVRLRVPQSLPPGEQTLRFAGVPADTADESELEEVLGDEMDGRRDRDEDRDREEPPPPRTLEELARRIAAIHRFDGVNAAWLDVTRPRQAYRDPHLRITGSTAVDVTVLPPRR
jgi:hypothetical protein